MFFNKGILLLEAEATQLKLCYMDKGARNYFEKIDIDDDVTVEAAVKGYTKRHGINPAIASLIVKSPEVKARYRKLEGIPLKMASKAVKAIDWHNITLNESKMIEDYRVVDVCDGSTCVFWAAVPEKLVMDYVKALKDIGITVEQVDVYHNCIVKNFCTENTKEQLVIFKYFGEAGIIHLKNGILTGIKDIMFDYDDPPTTKLYNAIDIGFSWTSIEKVYILNEELGFAKEYFDERGIACDVLTCEETEFLGLRNLDA